MNDSRELTQYIGELVERTSRGEINWREANATGFVWSRPKDNATIIVSLQKAVDQRGASQYLLEVSRRSQPSGSTRMLLSLSSGEKEYLGAPLSALYREAGKAADGHAASVLRSLLD